jgi:hypothetical protein
MAARVHLKMKVYLAMFKIFRVQKFPSSSLKLIVIYLRQLCGLSVWRVTGFQPWSLGWTGFGQVLEDKVLSVVEMFLSTQILPSTVPIHGQWRLLRWAHDEHLKLIIWLYMTELVFPKHLKKVIKVTNIENLRSLKILLSKPNPRETIWY